MVQLYHTATEYLSNTLTFKRGSVDDVTMVGVFHTQNPNLIPAASDFVPVTLTRPGDSLAQNATIDVLSLIGPGAGADMLLAPGDWQRWVLVKTDNETIIRKVDVVTIV